jgi:hypothetical protein
MMMRRLAAIALTALGLTVLAAPLANGEEKAASVPPATANETAGHSKPAPSEEGDPKVSAEIGGLERLDEDGLYTANHELFYQEFSLPKAENDETAVKSLIEGQFGKIWQWAGCEVVDEWSARAGYPVWHVQYIFGEDEAAKFCQDALVLLPERSALLHSSRAVSLKEEVQRGYERFVLWLFGTISVSAAAPSVSSGDGADMGRPYWGDLDFGPNLVYADEYQGRIDPDARRNAAEDAKVMFDDLVRCGYVPGDDPPYTMTLIDLADVNGSQSYVYRCENGKNFIALFARQSDGTCLQARGGEWTPLEMGDGDEDAESNQKRARKVVESALSEHVAELSASVSHGGEYALRYLGSDALPSGELLWVYEAGLENFTGFYPEERYGVNGDAVYVATPEEWKAFDGKFYKYNAGWKVRWSGRFNSIEFVDYALFVTNYDGLSFHYNINDEKTGVAELDPEDPYSARHGETVFEFNGLDTIDVKDGDAVETFFRPHE